MFIFEEDYTLGFSAVGDEVRVCRGLGTPDVTVTIVTLTPEGAECDCGKGLWCPLNEQRRV
jgi:hypothetical protein